jgi:hypothetical protein
MASPQENPYQSPLADLETVGVLLGILTLIPLIGLIVLLVINGKATKVLRANGHRVGLLGASLSEFS